MRISVQRQRSTLTEERRVPHPQAVLSYFNEMIRPIPQKKLRSALVHPAATGMSSGRALGAPTRPGGLRIDKTQAWAPMPLWPVHGSRDFSSKER